MLHDHDIEVFGMWPLDDFPDGVDVKFAIAWHGIDFCFILVYAWCICYLM